MKKFRFKLQTLLEHRQDKEEQLLAELAVLRHEEAMEIAKLMEIKMRLEQSRTNLEEALRRNAHMDEVFRYDEYMKALVDDTKVQELTIEAVKTRVEAKRLEVVEAMKDRQVLESLRDKHENAYLLAQARAEQNVIDEMSSVRFARGM